MKSPSPREEPPKAKHSRVRKRPLQRLSSTLECPRKKVRGKRTAERLLDPSPVHLSAKATSAPTTMRQPNPQSSASDQTNRKQQRSEQQEEADQAAQKRSDDEVTNTESNLHHEPCKANSTPEHSQLIPRVAVSDARINRAAQQKATFFYIGSPETSPRATEKYVDACMVTASPGSRVTSPPHALSESVGASPQLLHFSHPHPSTPKKDKRDLGEHEHIGANTASAGSGEECTRTLDRTQTCIYNPRPAEKGVEERKAQGTSKHQEETTEGGNELEPSPAQRRPQSQIEDSKAKKQGSTTTTQEVNSADEPELDPEQTVCFEVSKKAPTAASRRYRCTRCQKEDIRYGSLKQHAATAHPCCAGYSCPTFKWGTGREIGRKFFRVGGPDRKTAGADVVELAGDKAGYRCLAYQGLIPLGSGHTEDDARAAARCHLINNHPKALATVHPWKEAMLMTDAAEDKGQERSNSAQGQLGRATSKLLLGAKVRKKDGLLRVLSANVYGLGPITTGQVAALAELQNVDVIQLQEVWSFNSPAQEFLYLGDGWAKLGVEARPDKFGGVSTFVRERLALYCSLLEPPAFPRGSTPGMRAPDSLLKASMSSQGVQGTQSIAFSLNLGEGRAATFCNTYSAPWATFEGLGGCELPTGPFGEGQKDAAVIFTGDVNGASNRWGPGDSADRRGAAWERRLSKEGLEPVRQLEPTRFPSRTNPDLVAYRGAEVVGTWVGPRCASDHAALFADFDLGCLPSPDRQDGPGNPGSPSNGHGEDDDDGPVGGPGDGGDSPRGRRGKRRRKPKANNNKTGPPIKKASLNFKLANWQIFRAACTALLALPIVAFAMSGFSCPPVKELADGLRGVPKGHCAVQAGGKEVVAKAPDWLMRRAAAAGYGLGLPAALGNGNGAGPTCPIDIAADTLASIIWEATRLAVPRARKRNRRMIARPLSKRAAESAAVRNFLQEKGRDATGAAKRAREAENRAKQKAFEEAVGSTDWSTTGSAEVWSLLKRIDGGSVRSAKAGVSGPMLEGGRVLVSDSEKAECLLGAWTALGCSGEAEPEVEPAKYHNLVASYSEAAMAVDRLGKGSGADGIRREMLKQLPTAGFIALRSVANLSLAGGKLAKMWKAGVIRPRPKPGKAPCRVSGWRPITLGSTVCKVAERVVLYRLLRLFKGHEDQFGYKPKRPNLDNLARLDGIVQRASSEKGLGALVLFVDFSQAFGRAPPARVLQAMARCIGEMGRPHERPAAIAVMRWIRSFLGVDESRQVCVNVGGSPSSWATVECGAPQGSVLGPQVWNL